MNSREGTQSTQRSFCDLCVLLWQLSRRSYHVLWQFCQKPSIYWHFSQFLPVLSPLDCVLSPWGSILAPSGTALVPVGFNPAPIGMRLVPVEMRLAPVGKGFVPIKTNLAPNFFQLAPAGTILVPVGTALQVVGTMPAPRLEWVAPFPARQPCQLPSRQQIIFP
jgi:hypothetical protein